MIWTRCVDITINQLAYLTPEIGRGQEHASKGKIGTSGPVLGSFSPDSMYMEFLHNNTGSQESPFDNLSNVRTLARKESGHHSLRSTAGRVPKRSEILIPKYKCAETESTFGSPKGSNPYGDGVPILARLPKQRSVSRIVFIQKRDFRNLTSSKGAQPKTSDLNRAVTAEYNNSAVGYKSISALEKLRSVSEAKNVYRLMLSMDLFIIAYHKMKSKPGNMTPGTDPETLDGTSLKSLTKTINQLKNQSFQFKPVRREYIPKDNGKMRSLGIPSPRDKIVQEVMRMILERIFEPLFLDSSHGFRPNRGCHSAQKKISS
jgi:hypothetical protein